MAEAAEYKLTIEVPCPMHDVDGCRRVFKPEKSNDVVRQSLKPLVLGEKYDGSTKESRKRLTNLFRHVREHAKLSKARGGHGLTVEQLKNHPAFKPFYPRRRPTLSATEKEETDALKVRFWSNIKLLVINIVFILFGAAINADSN